MSDLQTPLDDRVQWFRAEADFERKQEMLESKHAEFERALRRFAWDRDTWATLSNKYSATPGHCAYAREHADMFESLRLDLEMKYSHGAIPFLSRRSTGETLASHVVQWRREEEKHLAFDWYACYCHCDGYAKCRFVDSDGRHGHLLKTQRSMLTVETLENRSYLMWTMTTTSRSWGAREETQASVFCSIVTIT